ncbi:MAG: hypothetical protein ACRDKB_05895 [Actinomycetota bacterium]
MLRPGGRVAYLTIVVAPGLTKSAHRLAVRLGPRAIATTRPLDELMHGAGFTDVDIIDQTPDFLAVARAWQVEYTTYEAELKPVLGAEWEERQSDRGDLIRGVEEGLLRRVLVAGRARLPD